jgi:signal transduction histidine kinase
VECQTECYLPPIETDRTQMSQVIVDLVKNAVEAIGESVPGMVSVRTAAIEIDGKSLPEIDLGAVTIAPGTYVALEVRDTGCGMDEEIRNRIFDPFFTTKSMGRGLGLAAVDGFVRSHKGGVQVDSSPGKGTRLRLLLPAAKERAARCLAS